MGTSDSQSTHHCVTEGNARAPFHTWVSLHNPDATAVDVLLQLRLDDGTTREARVSVGPRGCTTLDASDFAGVEGHAFAIEITGNRELVVTRTMAWDDCPATPGSGGPHLRLAGTWSAPSSAETTQGVCLVLENVGDAPAMAEIEGVTPGGRERRTVMVPAHGSRSVRGPAGGRDTVTRVAGTSRYFAGGETGRGAETLLTLTNHSARPCTVDIRYLPETLAPSLRRHVVAAHARMTIVAGEDAGFRRAESFGMHVRSVDGVAVDVERSTWWPTDGLEGWAEGHACGGALSTGTVFEVPVDGEDRSPVVLIANPGDQPAHVHVSAMDGASREHSLADVTIPGGRLQRACLQLRVAPGATRPTSIRVVCDDDAPIVVERATRPAELGPGGPPDGIGVPVQCLR